MKLIMKQIAFIQCTTLCLLFFIAFGTAFGQTSHRDLVNGDMLYDREQFDVAEAYYRSAVSKEPSAQAKYNLGNSLYEQERYQEAAEEFQQAINLSSDTMFRAKALYNKANSLFKEDKVGESLEAYKKSLLMNPNDEDVKKNYMRARQKMQQQQQQQQQEKKDDNQEQEQQQQQPQEQPQEQQEEQQEGQEQQQQQQEEDSEEKETDSEVEEKETDEMTREEAEQLLQIVENTDDYVQKKIKNKHSKKKKPTKNW